MNETRVELVTFKATTNNYCTDVYVDGNRIRCGLPMDSAAESQAEAARFVAAGCDYLEAKQCHFDRKIFEVESIQPFGEATHQTRLYLATLKGCGLDMVQVHESQLRF